MGTVIRPEVSAKNKYWISRHRYYELKHFCLQYGEWKENYIHLDGYSAGTGSEERISESEVSDKTAIYAEARIYYRDRMELVENTALKAAADLHDIFLKAITEGLSYEVVSPPCCKDVWYAIYRKFFWILDKTRK